MTRGMNAQDVLKEWSDDARQVAEGIMKKYGEPDEAIPSELIWHNTGPWKRTIVHREGAEHRFPIPHADIVEQIVDYQVPVDKFSDLAAFDGSVVAARTLGELAARCHDEEANFLATNLAHDIITGKRSVEDARNHYVESMKAFRRNEKAPYMEKLLFEPQKGARDPDERRISDEELKQAAAAAR